MHWSSWRDDSSSTLCIVPGCDCQLQCARGSARSDGSSAGPTPPASAACDTGVCGGRLCGTGLNAPVACSSSQHSTWGGCGVAKLWRRGIQTTSCCVPQAHGGHTSHRPPTDTACGREMMVCHTYEEECSDASDSTGSCAAAGVSSCHGCSSTQAHSQPSTRGASCHRHGWETASGRDAHAQPSVGCSHGSCAHQALPPSQLHRLHGRSRLASLLVVLLMLLGSCPRAVLARATRSRSGGGSQDGGSGGDEDGGGRAGDANCQPPEPLPGSAFKHWGCQRYKMMCIDQQQFVTYDPKYNPLISTEKPPGFDVKDVVYNWPNPYGNGDKFERGKDIHVPGVVIRVNTSEEASPDLQRPAFSACTRPIVLWQRWLFNVGEVFESSFVRMWTEFRGRDLQGAKVQPPDPRHSLVLATPHGLRVPRYAKLFFSSLFTQYEVTSLAELSARRHDMSEPTNSTAEGYHVRCFEEVLMCKIRNRLDSGLNSAGAHLLRHYRDRLPAVSDLFDVEGDDRDTLKVVLASRPNATGRAILNEQELLDACNRMDPQQELGDAGEPAWEAGAESYRGERRAFKRVKCVAHVFGRDMLYDLALAQAIDVLVATHGAAGYHSFYMSRGASLVEVMPFHFTPQWANAYYARMLENDKKVLYWQVWIQNSTHAHASAFEQAAVFRDEYLHREHHVTLPWPALKQHLVAVLQVGADPLRYKAAYKAGVHCINESGQPVEHRPDVADGGWPAVTREQLQALEEQEQAEAELDSARREAMRGGGGGGGEEDERRRARRRRMLGKRLARA